MSKTTRGKSNVDTRLGEEIEGGRAMAYKDELVKMTCNEGQRWSERWTRVANLKLIHC